MRRRSFGKGDRSQLGQGAHVDRALEVNHLTHGVPVGDPPELVEFGLWSATEVELHVLLLDSQQKPALLLSDAHGLLVAPHVLGGKPVAQPSRGLSQHHDVPARKPDLLIELAISSGFEALTGSNPPLGELPSPAPDLPAEK